MGPARLAAKPIDARTVASEMPDITIKRPFLPIGQAFPIAWSRPFIERWPTLWR